MKMRKALLAALAMTAMMAVSAVSPAYAEETTEAASETVVLADGHEETEAPKQTENATSIYKVTFETDGSNGVTIYYTDGTIKTGTGTPAVTAPTCVDKGYTMVTYTDEFGKVWESDAFNYTAALGHKADPEKTKTWESTAPTCEVDGEKTIKYVCSRCQYEWYDYDPIDALDHDWGSYLYENVSNVVVDATTKQLVYDTDGKVKLIDDTKDGYYNIYQVCKRDSSHVQYVKTNVLVLAKQTTSAKVIKTSGIVESESTIYTGKVFKTDDTNGNKKTIWEQLPANDSIEMKDCTKDGYYVLEYYNSNGDSVGQETIPVTAHHMTSVCIEFNSTDDKALCTVKYSTNGQSYTITNSSCYLTVTYNVVTHCRAAGCPKDECPTLEKLVATGNPLEKGVSVLHKVDSFEKTVTPGGTHRIAAMIRSDINNLAEAGLTYDELVEYVEGCGYKDYITLSNNTSDCENDGTIDITYKCLVCKTDVTKDNVNLVKRGHLEMAPVKEETKQATCTEYGTYKAVTYCEHCGDVLREVRNLKEAMKAHTNDISREDNGICNPDYGNTLLGGNVTIEFVGDKVVDLTDGSILKAFQATPSKLYENYIGYGENNEFGGKDEFGVYAIAYSTCKSCGGHKIQISEGKGSTGTAAENYDVTIKVTSCTKQSSNGYAGSITLEATYTRTVNGVTQTGTATDSFPYFTTMSSYEGRVEKEVKNGIAQGSDGKYYYYTNDEVDTSVTGIRTYNGEKFFVSKGVVCSEANGLNLNAEDGKWYYLSLGRVCTEATQVVSYDGHYFYVTNGELDKSVTGLVLFDGEYFLFAEGRLLNDVNGLWMDETSGKWYFLSLARLCKEFSGVAMYDGAFFKVTAGVLEDTYNGTTTYDGHTFKVVNGRLTDMVA